ncbi:hypothetical protein GLOTRDRAFT_138166 [Gloeophyllum trabeum ATCC 11539]|uniref:mRNA decay factor PAT1 domain-containing protein n=1 Tax=Gloeophyllum trabeum (strain ATCC 11539 / FP-39264 / Madison 617) TaxID=670483 RepID=S7RPH0_GLOTA|nr:uncharacterized protein GLOTRDRAFT_138166 [Gloeophyllum trabeum ATCC 11539]EPQ56435.1 hypothetical protein GLOTRDRAFT_138166 [Gloeophyllum trabeum ATCC 11539]
MAFFGFETSNLEQEKEKFLSGKLNDEGVAEYTWGEDSYDGLGDILQEQKDELNDETFGVGDVGKDFDFTQQVLPDDVPPEMRKAAATQPANGHAQERSFSPPQSEQHSSQAPPSLQSLWDNKSPFSVLPRTSGNAVRPSEHHPRHAGSPDQSPFLNQSQSTQSTFSPFSDVPGPVRQSPALAYEPSLSRVGSGMEVRTLQEIEAEMRAGAMRARETPQLRQQLLQAQARTPPPRLHPHAQSPRFHQLQQHILIQQQQQQQQQQLQLQDLQEQLRMEELERQMRAQQITQLQQQQQQMLMRRQSPSGPTLAEIQAAQHLAQLQQEQRRRQHSPALSADQRYHISQPVEDNSQYLPQNIQMQQRLLAELAHAEFVRDYGTPQTQEEQEALRAEAVRKIMEAERMEEKRRRKAAKIAHMSRYNDLMTQSDKDFITRIQVSQLVTQDPYLEDFYAQVYAQLVRARTGLRQEEQRVLTFDSGVGVGLGMPGQRPSGRKHSAVQRMEAQVERIVNNARQREKEKGMQSLNSLQGALGKTAGRSYKAAPRQLLQVDSPKPSTTGSHLDEEERKKAGEHAAREAAKLGREALERTHDTQDLVRKDPLNRFDVLVILERLYDLVLRVGQLPSDEPDEDGAGDAEERPEKLERKQLLEEIYDNLRVKLPIETSDPHPFISLIGPIKGKRLIPRIWPHLEHDQMATILTLLIACFSQLDVVRHAFILDSLEDTPQRREVDQQTTAFSQCVMQSIVGLISRTDLKLLNGLVGLFFNHDIVAIARTKPGLEMLMIFLARAEMLQQNFYSGAEPNDTPTPDDMRQWRGLFDLMFDKLTPHLIELFPSERVLRAQSGGNAQIPPEYMDTAAWRFLASVGQQASGPQQQILVTALREKVLDLVIGVKRGWVADEEERELKITNVNTFLHALQLDSSQITVP